MSYINRTENRQYGILHGNIERISTIPAWQHTGVSRAMITLSLKAQRAAGMIESALVCIGEKLGNARFSAGCGFQEVKRDTVYEKKLEILA